MKRRNWQVITLVVLLVMAMLTAPIAASPGQGVEREDYLVGFHGTPNKGLLERLGGDVYAEFDFVKAMAVRLPPQAAVALEKNPMIAYVEPDAEVYALEQTVPWGIDRVFGEETYSFGTWNNSRGEGIGVAVLDTGIDSTHEDLVVAGGRRFYIQGLWLREDNQYQDKHGHGTHVAGTIAGLDNGLGVVGVAPSADLYAVKVLTDSGSGSTSAIIAGIDWVIKNSKTNNIRIINMSLGSGTYSETFKNACDKAFLEGVLVVSSAGNSGNEAGTGDTVGYPAKYASVIAVAASDINNNRAYFSSTGQDVELIAPGVSVLSTVPGNQYASYSGTSMASPHVAGVAALVWGADSSLSNDEVRAILKSNTQNLGLPFNHQGYGLVRADLAVAAAGGGTEPVVEHTITATAGAGGTISPEGEVKVTEGNNQNFTISPSAGYEIDDVKVDGVSVGKVTTYTFDNVRADHTIEATFAKITVNPPDDPVLEGVTILEPADGTSFKYNAWVNILVKTLGGVDQPVANAAVTVIIENPDGAIVGIYTGNTSADGTFTASYRVANKSPTGDYTISATAFKEGLEQNDSVVFKVIGR